MIATSHDDIAHAGERDADVLVALYGAGRTDIFDGWRPQIVTSKRIALIDWPRTGYLSRAWAAEKVRTL